MNDDRGRGLGVRRWLLVRLVVHGLGVDRLVVDWGGIWGAVGGSVGWLLGGVLNYDGVRVVADVVL